MCFRSVCLRFCVTVALFLVLLACGSGVHSSPGLQHAGANEMPFGQFVCPALRVSLSLPQAVLQCRVQGCRDHQGRGRNMGFNAAPSVYFDRALPANQTNRQDKELAGERACPNYSQNCSYRSQDPVPRKRQRPSNPHKNPADALRVGLPWSFKPRAARC